jgi:hypothetical protein
MVKNGEKWSRIRLKNGFSIHQQFNNHPSAIQPSPINNSTITHQQFNNHPSTIQQSPINNPSAIYLDKDSSWWPFKN